MSTREQLSPLISVALFCSRKWVLTIGRVMCNVHRSRKEEMKI
jgi:hypothetical protein